MATSESRKNGYENYCANGRKKGGVKGMQGSEENDRTRQTASIQGKARAQEGEKERVRVNGKLNGLKACKREKECSRACVYVYCVCVRTYVSMLCPWYERAREKKMSGSNPPRSTLFLFILFFPLLVALITP